MNLIDPQTLKLYATHALPKPMPEGVLSVSVEAHGTTIHWRCVFSDLSSKEKHEETMWEASTIFIANYSDPFMLDEEYLVAAPGKKITPLAVEIYSKTFL